MKRLTFRLIGKGCKFLEKEKDLEIFMLSGEAEKFENINDEIYLNGGGGDFNYWRLALMTQKSYSFHKIYSSLLNIAEKMKADKYMKPEYKILIETK